MTQLNEQTNVKSISWIEIQVIVDNSKQRR